MINITNQEHFDRVVAEAARRGLMPELQKQLDYLGSYGCHIIPNNTRCDLGYDFAPMSFSFLMYVLDGKEYKPWFNGGLIFHPGVTGPDQSLSCELVGSDTPHWSVHT